MKHNRRLKKAFKKQRKYKKSDAAMSDFLLQKEHHGDYFRMRAGKVS